jgi:hypothetical protein
MMNQLHSFFVNLPNDNNMNEQHLPNNGKNIATTAMPSTSQTTSPTKPKCISFNNKRRQLRHQKQLMTITQADRDPSHRSLKDVQTLLLTRRFCMLE